MSAVLCLGEALVDLIAEAPVASVSAAERFAPHFGGTTANVAIIAARAGARVSLAGAAGEDRWGRWLRERLTAENVNVDRFVLLPGVATQLAFVAVDEHGEPTYELYEAVAETFAEALGDDVEAAVEEASGLFISSNTLPGRGEREVTMRARERALTRTPPAPVIVDCDLRMRSWGSLADAAASVNACVPGALLVRASRFDAELLTGERDPERAALALRKAGAELVVIGLGDAGTMLRGAGGLNADVSPVPVTMRSAVGAGDALTGTLLAALERSGYYPAAVAAALDDAVAAAARACESWGALD